MVTASGTINGLNYIGNPDYRGVLNYAYQAGDANAGSLIGTNGAYGLVDNSGYFSNGRRDMAPVAPSILNANNYYWNAYQNALNPGSAGAGGTSGGAASNPDFINQAYNTKIAGLKSILDTLQPQQDAATLNVNNQYQNQSNALQTQNAEGQRNLQIAGNQVQQSKAQSLDDLRKQVQTLGMGYNNQLGAYGAGDSSASGLIQQALSGMASRNRSGVMNNAAQQQQAIDLQGQDLQTEFNNNMKALDDWKVGSLNDIATKFLQQRQKIQQQMVGADAERYQTLAQANAAYTNQAIAQLANLENTYRSQASDLISQYQNIRSPQNTINPNLLQYAVSPITPGQIASFSSVPQLNTGNNGYAVPRKFNEDYGLSLQGF